MKKLDKLCHCKPFRIIQWSLIDCKWIDQQAPEAGHQNERESTPFVSVCIDCWVVYSFRLIIMILLVDWAALSFPFKEKHSKKKSARRSEDNVREIMDTCDCSLFAAEPQRQTKSVNQMPLTLLEAYNALCLNIWFVLLWICKKNVIAWKTDSNTLFKHVARELSLNMILTWLFSPHRLIISS